MKKRVLVCLVCSVVGCVADEFQTDEQYGAIEQSDPGISAQRASPASTASLDPTDPTDPSTRGGCSSFPPTPCGEVQNNTTRTIRVSLNWTCTATTAPLGSSCPQSIESLAPGGHRGGGNVDVDAFEVAAGCTFSGSISTDFGGTTSFTRSEGWYKFSSNQNVTVKTASCGGGGGGCAVFPCFQ